MTNDGSVTNWVRQLESGDPAAAQLLWDRYLAPMLEQARKRLPAHRRRMADEDDIALSAFRRFFRGVERGQFVELNDRGDVLQILMTLINRRAVEHLRHELRAKRGGGLVLGESALAHGSDVDSPGSAFQWTLSAEPSPEMPVILAEELQRILDRLSDDDLRLIAIRTIEGHTPEEISHEMGCVKRTVERKLARIKTMLREEPD